MQQTEMGERDPQSALSQLVSPSLVSAGWGVQRGGGSRAQQTREAARAAEA